MAFRGIWKRAFQLYNFFVLLPSSYITFQVDALYVEDVAAVLFSNLFVVRDLYLFFAVMFFRGEKKWSMENLFLRCRLMTTWL